MKYALQSFVIMFMLTEVPLWGIRRVKGILCIDLGRLTISFTITRLNRRSNG